MKTKFALIAVTAVLLLIGGCHKPSIEPVIPSLSISPNTESVTFSVAATESYTFTVTTNQPEWDATSNKEWCIVDKDYKNNTFQITAKKNPSTVTPEPAIVTVTAGDADAIKIDATQDANSIYVCGRYYKDSEKAIPCYWKDGKRTDLTFPATAENIVATHITVSNGIVYIVGQVDEKKACIWIDGEFSELTAPADAESYYASGIALHGENVYISGKYTSDSGDVPCYWVNNECKALQVPENAYDPFVTDVTFVDGKLYITGGYSEKACLWIDGVRTDLKDVPDTTLYACAYSVAVSGESQYIGGYYFVANGNVSESHACYWKNGVRTDLPVPSGNTNSYTTSIATENGIAYLCGYYILDNRFKACYWTEEKRTDLSVPDVNQNFIWASSLCVSDSKVYVSGYYSSEGVYPCYWINGEFRELEIPEGSKGGAEDIVIAESR